MLPTQSWQAKKNGRELQQPLTQTIFAGEQLAVSNAYG